MRTTPPPAWANDFCRDYAPFLFSAGKWTLIAGILLGIALGIATIILLLRKKEGAADGIKAMNAATPVAMLDAVKGFLQALSSAPTWLALFGGGVLLLWLAGNAIPEICKPQAAQCTQQCPPTQPAR